MQTIVAYQIAGSINLKQFRNEYAEREFRGDFFELFYQHETNRYLLVLSYGVVVFSGYDEIKISEFFDLIKPYCHQYLDDKISDKLMVYDNEKEDKFGFNEIYISRVNPEIMRIIMLNAGQSVAIDYFSQQAGVIMNETSRYTNELASYGKIRLSSKKLLQFIGRTMSVRNSIIDNLYIIDSPDETWEDSYLAKLDTGLKNIFDIRDRFRDLDMELRNVKDNLDIFLDIMQHKKSNLLEIIIIVLILIEVVHLFVREVIPALLNK